MVLIPLKGYLHTGLKLEISILLSACQLNIHMTFYCLSCLKQTNKGLPETPIIYPTWHFQACKRDPTHDNLCVCVCNEHLQTSNTAYFGKLFFPPNFFNVVWNQIPQWIRNLPHNNFGSLQETLMEHVANADHEWFDHYPVSVQGDNWNHGADLLTWSPPKKGTQDLNIFLSVNSKQCKNK